jgi:hypothetical protein
MKRMYFGAVAALALALASTPLAAQEFNPSRINPVFELPPYDQVLWFNPERNGEGWSLGTIRHPTPGEGPIFAGTLYTYQPDGSPEWLLMQGSYTAATPQETTITGITGRATGVLYQGRNGNCPVCPAQPATVQPSPYGQGEMVFKHGTRAEVWMDGVRVDTIQPIDFQVTRLLRDRLTGTWRGQSRRDGFVSGDAIEVWTFEPSVDPTRDGQYVRVTNDVRHVPNPASTWVKGLQRFANNPQFSGHTWHVTIDEQEGRVRGFMFQPTHAITVPGSFGAPIVVGYNVHNFARAADFFFTGFDTLVLRLSINSTLGDQRPYEEIILRRDP